MWVKAYKVLNTLHNAGYEAVYAGGCVRDLLLFRKPKDIDIATNARPEQIEVLFPRTLALGKSFGVITVLQDEESFEVATFRKDGVYEDGRHPRRVEFCEMEEDAKRRDFTINGMFYDPTCQQVVDYVGGKEDLIRRQIRFIGSPEQRIVEDKLRMLRAIKFAVRYGFSIEPQSFEAIQNNAFSILQVSFERIREELFQLLCCENSGGLGLLLDSGLLRCVLPEVSCLKGIEQGELHHPEGDTWEHTKLVVSHVSLDPVIRMAALLHDIAKPHTFKIRNDRPTFYGHADQGEKVAREILKRLKCSNDFIDEVGWLVRNHMKFFQVKNMKNSTLIKLFRHASFKKLLELHKADVLGSNDDLSLWEYTSQKYEELQSYMWPQPLLNGNLLKDLGYVPGPLFNTILKDVESQQLNGTLKNTKEAITYIQLTYSKEII
jgi:poly(A) polymerase